MLHGIIPRPYQYAIFQIAKDNNTLVVLPTGLGKTAISLLLAAQRLINFPHKKLVFLAPTKPLVEQQLRVFQESLLLPEEDFVLFTGNVSPQKRQEQWLRARIVFSTPQTLENDLLSGKISFSDVSLLIFDEAHRAIGDYAYTFLAEKYVEQATHQRIIALTASPGADEDKINEVCKNLYIRKVQYRKSTDADVKGFTQETTICWEEVLLTSEVLAIVNYLKSCHAEKLAQVASYGLLPKPPSSYTKSALLLLQRDIHVRISQGETSFELLHAMSLLAQSLKLQHALELAETQSLHALHAYFHSVLIAARQGKTKAVKSLAKDPLFLAAFAKTRDLIAEGKEHPKLEQLIQQVNALVTKNPAIKIIIFTHFRDTAIRLQKDITSSNELFFGQAKKNGKGLTQKEQKEILRRFRNGEFNILIATSVAEEGLDIPSVDHVFFFEPLPSAIRSVQRRGRTGRHTKGFVTVFVAKNTRDEVNRWAAFHKEKRMFRALDKVNGTVEKSLIFNKPISQKKLSSFASEENIKLFADFREKGSPVLKALLAQEVNLELKQLQVGDFVLSKDVCVEYKQMDDFLTSIIDGRLLSQLRSLAQYEKPLLILEGIDNFSSLRKVEQAAVLGMYATIVTSYKIPLLRTFSPIETAKLLLAIARREQEENKGSFTFHSAKPFDKQTLQEYVVSSFPQIGGALAKALLEKFDSIYALINASKEELLEVPLIGKKKADELYGLFSQSYKAAKQEYTDA
ncbi:DEAD/DEAH box helicase [Candidatus Woesearchaeota archaeon]|nr:DEAD/DEAH box helicase [Candidatus Woesearchaeota archaeon]